VSHIGTVSVDMVAAVAFTLLLAGACVSDVRARRIPNVIVAAVFLGGLGYAFAVLSPGAALGRVLSGSAVGLALWLPFWLIGVLGAGDVKLAAASGAWLGAAGTVEASLLAAVAGGLLAVWALVRQGGITAAAARFGAWLLASRATSTLAPELTPRERRVPYGLAIAAGAVVAIWVPGLIW
jgi:prepilin peptidase CpaA